MPRHRHTCAPKSRPLSGRIALAVGIALVTAMLGMSAYAVLGVERSPRTIAGDVLSATAASVGKAAPMGKALTPGVRRRHHAHRRHAPHILHRRPVPTATSTASCSGASNTPGGPDPWGGCWPGPDNTGVPAGTALTAYTGPCEITASDVVIDARAVNCALSFTGSSLTITDSMINGEVFNNGSGSVLIQDSELNGGSDHSETVLGSNLEILSSNLHGNQHEVYCADNCTIENSWLHDNFNGASLGWHQNGFLSTGGYGYTLEHNSVGCVGGCTGDITFIPNGNVSHGTVDKNLLVATSDVAYCLYPSSDSSGKPGIVSQMTVTDNVFQRGSNGKCGYFGPVYGWDTPNNSPGTDGYGNVWSGNMWDNGEVLESP
jgi:hypothetical protein